MDHSKLNAELRDFCKKLVNDGYNKSQLCSIILGQQMLPMLSKFLENDDRNFGIGVLSRIFDVFGYELKIVPVLKGTPDDPKLNEAYTKFIENYHMMFSEGLANQEAANEGKGERESKVATAINQVALEMFQQITQRG
jgi:hypothetical protein